MKTFDFLDKISIFNRLVEQKHTGTPKEFAERLGMGRSTLYEVIDELHSRDVDVKYSRKSRTYYYKNIVSMEVRLIVKRLDELDDDEAKKIAGGRKFFSSVLFFGRKDLIFVPA
jgi:predicted transcriptional regulator